MRQRLTACKHMGFLSPDHCKPRPTDDFIGQIITYNYNTEMAFKFAQFVNTIITMTAQNGPLELPTFLRTSFHLKLKRITSKNK